MPIEFGIWKINGPIERVHFSPLDSEVKLESALIYDISILDSDLMVIGQQVHTGSGRIDILAINSQGDISIIELKRDRTPREVVAQLLDYGSWIQTLHYEDIKKIFAKYRQGMHFDFEQVFAERYPDSNLDDGVNRSHRLIVVASELDSSTERIISYLSGQYNVPINAVFFRYFRQGQDEYLARTWLVDPSKTEANTDKVAANKSGKEPWNGRDFYVALGEGEHRNWEDCRKYGFISAGHGVWYSQTLKLLFPGARVFVYVPKRGYVGVGIVKEPVVPVSDFRVEVEGKEIPILQAPLQARNMGEDMDNPELSEYVVGVDWLKTVPVRDAIRQKGFFAKQNTVCRLSSSFTINTLIEVFGIEE